MTTNNEETEKNFSNRMKKKNVFHFENILC